MHIEGNNSMLVEGACNAETLEEAQEAICRSMGFPEDQRVYAKWKPKTGRLAMVEVQDKDGREASAKVLCLRGEGVAEQT
jgi:hypothetical protein